jgi:AcrR family transcriptional regulator
MARTGRRPGTVDNRTRILTAARDAFASHGFEGATIRSIARAADVDPALVHHFFGSKEALFLQAMQVTVDVEAVMRGVLSGGPVGVGERCVREVLATWERPEVRPVILGILRSATTDPQAALLLRRMVSERILGPLTRALGSPEAEMRAALAGSQMVGLLMAVLVVGIEPLASADREVVARLVGPTIERYLIGDLSPAG